MALKRQGNSMKKRMNIVLFVMVFIGFGILIARLYQIQIVDGEMYRGKALAQQLRPTQITAKRGNIYDRNKKILASSATVWTVTISPAEIKDAAELEKIADFLSETLDVDRENIITRGKKEGSYYEIIKKKVEDDKAREILKFASDNKIGAINLVEDTKRYYPYGNLCSTVLGFTDDDNNGAYGLESYYNKVLSGTDGMVVSNKNAKSGDMPFSYDKMFEPQDGNSLVLTIDEVIQHSLEKHLETAVMEHNVQNRGTGIVMDVNTGAILAMATKPDFDPNEPSKLCDPLAKIRIEEYAQSEELQEELSKIPDPEERAKKERELKQTFLEKEWFAQWRNKAVSDPYEPGSVFKLVTASMALDLGTASPEGSRYYCPGYHVVAGRRKACWKREGHGDIAFWEAIKYSCNPAFMMIGAAIGPENFYDYFDRFGLREATGIDLPGESDGIFYNLKTLSKESGEELASSSFGQTFKITPIQLATAVSAVVNGGKLMQPYVVSQQLDSEGNVVKTTKPQAKRSVITEKTSKTVAGIMEHVVCDEDASGKKAYVPGYRIGGKTGTSEKLDAKEDGEVTKRIASFAGIAPSNDPQILCLVLFDEPYMTNIYGSVLAAPVVGSIMADICPYLGIEPQYTERELAEKEVECPYVEGQLVHDGISEIVKNGLNYKIYGSGTRIIRQLPPAHSKMPKGSDVRLYTEPESEEQGVLMEVPDVVGMTVEQARRTLLNSQFNVNYEGKAEFEGDRIKSQSPKAGEMAKTSTVVTISYNDEIESKKP